ncbi:MAG: hypothetical protein A3I98_02865 [Candidatus Taylorbacteria bacterium RIFCSPLOWO2_02_FULL_45_10b]|nr:MAG: hypothetical protein A3I98_02865 [Candidatus Taylorbacteria bacterium RIFCSPLOWO2_02_FULL_45_10b]
MDLKTYLLIGISLLISISLIFLVREYERIKKERLHEKLYRILPHKRHGMIPESELLSKLAEAGVVLSYDDFYTLMKEAGKEYVVDSEDDPTMAVAGNHVPRKYCLHDMPLRI